ncbi:MAG: OprO/OprP family phosphate-selective porin [Gemmatimonadaceae bacterium]|nr:OprO/OprP family phosphate-selective porin [Gemmatimonadaceae bacterium]
MKRTLLLLVAAAAPLVAQSGDAQGPTFGGLGSVSGGVTNRGTYLAGTPDGSYQNSQFGLRASMPFGDKLAISGLVNWREEGQQRGQPRSDITYLFATYRLSRAWDLRLGKVKHPSNLYSEVFDIGTLRPFLTLPQGIYGGTGNAFTSYTGVGVNGTAYVGDWQFGVASYLGGGNFRYNSTRIDLVPGSGGDVDVNVRTSGGARVFVRPPVRGLLIGLSGLRGTIAYCVGSIAGPQCGSGINGSQGSVQLEYMTDKLWLRSEWAALRGPGFINTRGGYGQLAYFVTRKLQLATQYDYLRETFDGGIVAFDPSTFLPPGTQLPPGVQLPPIPNAIDKHSDIALGVNWWFSPDVVAKLSVHSVDGWRFARPGSSAILGGLLTNRFPAEKSTLLQAGIQFSF